MREIPQCERLISEEYRIAAKEWVAAEDAAFLLMENKKSTFSQMVLRRREDAEPKTPYWLLEAAVYASPEWIAYIEEMAKARTAANKAKVKMKWVEMRFQEQNSAQAAARIERRLSQ